MTKEIINVLVENVSGILVTTSNRVAEELGVEHKNLLAKIDSYVKQFGGLTFSHEFYIQSTFENRGKNYRNFLITEKGIAQLLGGYSNAVPIAFKLNVAYINKFEEMKNYIKNSVNNISKKDLLMLNIMKANTEMTRLVAINEYETEYVRPLEIKEEYHDKVLDSDGTLTVREIAQDFGKTANWLNKILNGLGIQFKQGKKWHLYSKYKDMELVKEITVLDEENDKNYTKMKWTQKGREFIHRLLKENCIIE